MSKKYAYKDIRKDFSGRGKSMNHGTAARGTQKRVRPAWGV